MKDINISDGIFIWPPGSCLRADTWGTGVGVGVKKKILEIQPNLVCELLTCMACATAQLIWVPPPSVLVRGQKVKHHLISITKSIPKILNQTLCVF